MPNLTFSLLLRSVYNYACMFSIFSRIFSKIFIEIQFALNDYSWVEFSSD
jgi:hypothetical protein